MVFSVLTFDDHVVDVDLHYVVDLLALHAGDHPLIGGSGVLEDEGHDFIAICSLRSDEGCLLHVVFGHRDLVVPPLCIQEAEACMAGSRVDQLIDPVQRKAVLQTGIVQIGVVDTDAPLPAVLLDDDSVGEPGGVLDLSNGSILEQSVDFFDDNLCMGRR